MLGSLFTFLFLLSLYYSVLSGNEASTGNALLLGAQAAIPFCLSITGSLCFWSAWMELAERSGLAARISSLLLPLLRRLFPRSSQEGEILEALSENMSANLLGLGNAATPAGIRAARGMARLGEAARDELPLLVVLNTASLQLIPGTIAAVRAAAGASAPFDIIPAVWLSSLLSVGAGLGAAALFKRRWPSSL
ncbi:MAG: spore maturation protein A [Clostridia bacterium]